MLFLIAAIGFNFRWFGFDEETLLGISFLSLIYVMYNFLQSEVGSVFSSKVASIASLFNSNIESKIALYQSFTLDQQFLLEYNKTFLTLLSDFSIMFHTYLVRLNALTNLLVSYFFQQLVVSILKTQIAFRSKFKLYLFINWSNYIIYRDFLNNPSK
jgi:hypothetical protein